MNLECNRGYLEDKGDTEMKEFQHVLQSGEGFQAKPAIRFVQMVKGLDSAVTVSGNDNVVSADRLAELAALDVHKGERITVTFEDHVSDEDVERFREFAREYL